MTGGQMAPTTLLGQVTSTTPYGRDAKLNGFPMKITELLHNSTEPVMLPVKVQKHLLLYGKQKMR